MDSSIVREVVEFSTTKNHIIRHISPAINQLIDNQEVFFMCLFVTDEVVTKYKRKFLYLTFKRWMSF